VLAWGDGMREWSEHRPPRGEPPAPLSDEPASPSRDLNDVPSPDGERSFDDYRAGPTTETCAVLALLFSVVGLGTCPLIGITGIVLGHLARRRIRQSKGTLTGSGLALAGILIGWVGVVLLPLAFVLYLLINPPSLDPM
jgi:hypothetical protein